MDKKSATNKIYLELLSKISKIILEAKTELKQLEDK